MITVWRWTGRAPHLVIAAIWLLLYCALPSHIYGNNVCRWVKLWEINHLIIALSITFRCIFHCTVAIDTGSLLALWQQPDYGNNQMHNPTGYG